MKILAITQARYSSSRLPGKVLLPLGKKTVLDLHLQRIKKSKLINDFMVATTQEAEAEKIEAIAKENGFKCFHGNLDDVLDRFYQAAKIIAPDVVLRFTSDCPLIDPVLIDDLISQFLQAKVDYASNCMNPTLPDGMDVEIFHFSALDKAWKESTLRSEREHVTPYIRNSGSFTIKSIQYSPDLSNYRLTLDTESDYQVLKAVIDACGEFAEMKAYVEFIEKKEDIKSINENNQRNEGLLKSLKEDYHVKTGNKL